MLKINSKTDTVKIEFLGIFPSYDGHCLRAYHYWKNEMPDITSQLEEIKKENKVFKVTKDDGTIEYLNENNPKLKEYQKEVISNG